ncbi:phosphoribosyltransferase family protein [Ichthyenterobacterium sp. W332]|uniref:Phosphoribosyltransferase family protein n=2 Tax=Microcosmobacter mediterraneus TaxID=3075607 RepID=A0ABU2YK90_9FLAO|nr:phosphoribosyltransferase family protein [Ichthyenterobacterium sp. W332]MDT0558240.1 phosphoribosyltransferase family protein [Ichthyenterobacterium sp. W332]
MLSDNEQYICTSCRQELPVTNFHFDNSEVIKKILYGRVLLKNATALLHFNKKSNVQQLLHNLKYRNHETIGTVLGQWLGYELSTLESYKSIDIVIPVPLHKSKLKTRGYNQVAKFAQEIARALDAEYRDDVLTKTLASKTQVFKNRLSRWINTEEKFSLKSTENLQHKHILLVDDIITTGATIEACSNQLFQINSITLSVATMAITD